jgi:hypothetical protein
MLGIFYPGDIYAWRAVATEHDVQVIFRVVRVRTSGERATDGCRGLLDCLQPMTGGIFGEPTLLHLGCWCFRHEAACSVGEELLTMVALCTVLTIQILAWFNLFVSLHKGTVSKQAVC